MPPPRPASPSASRLSIAYIVSRRLLPWAGVLSFVAMAPFVVPGIVLAIAFYAAYAPPPLALYGTRADPDPRLRHALPADRLCQCRCGDPQHQPGDGRGGAHPRAAGGCARSGACWRR